MDASRNAGYRSFYRTINGLPITLGESIVSQINEVEEVKLNCKEVYSISMELKEPMISDRWLLYLNKDYYLEAVRFLHNDPEREDEMIIFDGKYTFEAIMVPRFRHWYEAESMEYLGSDVIVKELDEAE